MFSIISKADANESAFWFSCCFIYKQSFYVKFFKEFWNAIIIEMRSLLRLLLVFVVVFIVIAAVFSVGIGIVIFFSEINFWKKMMMISILFRETAWVLY